MKGMSGFVCSRVQSGLLASLIVMVRKSAYSLAMLLLIYPTQKFERLVTLTNFTFLAWKFIYLSYLTHVSQLQSTNYKSVNYVNLTVIFAYKPVEKNAEI